MKTENENSQQAVSQPQPQFQSPQWGGSRMSIELLFHYYHA
jgi:hypothetical protein